MRPTAIITLRRPGPMRTTIPSARRMLGKASITSIRRMSTLSAHPPKKPATAPRMVPRTMARLTDTRPIVRLTRAAWITRLH
jgi:hypothetical protein